MGNLPVSISVLSLILCRLCHVDSRSARSRNSENSVQNLDFVKFGVSETETELTSEDFQRFPRRKEGVLDPEPDLLYQRDLFEGDILGITKDTIDDFIDEMNAQDALTDYFSKLGDNIRYQAIKDQSRLWLGSEVPYSVSSLYTDEGKATIAEAIQTITNNTCIKFVPRTLERDYLFITPKGGGCSSFVGRQRGRQQVQLGPDCLNQLGIILHEFMHSLGFFHEQSRADRDDYIYIKWENIHPSMAPNFRSYRLNFIQHLGAEYDFGSVMHYGPYAFSKTGAQTILPMIPNLADEMGQRKQFSRTDLYKLNKLYGCLPREDSTPWPGFVAPPEDPIELIPPKKSGSKISKPSPPSGLPPVAATTVPTPVSSTERMSTTRPSPKSGIPLPPSSLPPAVKPPGLLPPAPIPPTPTEETKVPVKVNVGQPPSIRPKPPGIRPPPLTPAPPAILPVTLIPSPPSMLPLVTDPQPPSGLPPTQVTVEAVTRTPTVLPLTGPPTEPTTLTKTSGPPQPPSGLPRIWVKPDEWTIAPPMPKELTLAPPIPKEETITPPMFPEGTITPPMPKEGTITPPMVPKEFTITPEIGTVTPDEMTVTPDMPTITPKLGQEGEDEEETPTDDSGREGQERVLYHPYECFVREDNNKLMYWPDEGYPRSDYICIITEDPRAWRGYRYEVRRLSCTWEMFGIECKLRRGETRRCWNRFTMTCPSTT